MKYIKYLFEKIKKIIIFIIKKFKNFLFFINFALRKSKLDIF